MAALIGLFAGALVGNLLWHEWGAALGGIVGFLVGVKLLPRSGAVLERPRDSANASASKAATRSSHTGAAGPGAASAFEQRIAELERRVASLESAQAGADAADLHSGLDGGKEAGGAGGPSESGPAPLPASSAAGGATAPVVEDATRVDAALPTAAAAAETIAAGPRANPVWRWFTGGNALARIGAVVLFFGVAFLLKYFAERFTVPIEWRLAAVAVAGLGLVGLGLRVARARAAYGITLQGAGAGVLYLTTYTAFRLYGVLPEAPAIAALAAVSALTVFLAVRSDTQALAGLALAGGFVAPFLIAVDSDPLWLFGYFAALNGTILALAWTKSWRALNALGFVFTFVLGALWGRNYYRPEQFAVVQPFLALFFAFYVAIAIRYVWRGPLAARNPVDGVLVFGVPAAGFALQAALVRDVPHGAAWSALGLAVVYAALFVVLRRRGEAGAPLLARAFLALSVVFATFAVPLAFDNRVTAAIWAIAGAGAYWIGVRQNALVIRAYGLLVQLGSGIVFVASGVAGRDDALFANAFFAGALLIAVSGLVSAFVADRAGDRLRSRERGLVPLVFAWGGIWWLAGGGVELVRQLSGTQETHAVLAWVTAAVALALALRERLRWSRLAGAGIALLPTMAVAAIGDFDLARTTLVSYGSVVWPCAWLVHVWALRCADAPRFDADGAAAANPIAATALGNIHALSAVALTVQLSWEASEWTGRATALHTAWTPCAAALPAIAFLWLVARFGGSTRWPVNLHRPAYARGAGIPVALLLAAWYFAVNLLSPGDASPLPYLPLASPLDLTLALALYALAAWAMRYAPISEGVLYRAIGAGAFVALNGIVLRTAHHWADVPWRLASMLASKPLQAALTLAWTATALPLMYVATRRRLRPLWMLGAVLLAAVVGKLFLVDLRALSGLPRVVAFLGVGTLLLVIGYVSPLPPAPTGDEPGQGGPAGA